MSDRIETFLIELLKNEKEGYLEIGRNELASIFQCVPSQINYVIATRFSPERGYLVESRRGGGGCLRIRRIDVRDAFGYALDSVGNSLDAAGARSIVSYLMESQKITPREASLLLACSEAFQKTGEAQNILRAEAFQNMLIKLAQTEGDVDYV